MLRRISNKLCCSNCLAGTRHESQGDDNRKPRPVNVDTNEMKRKKVFRETSDHANSHNSHSHSSVDCVESTSKSVEQSIGTAEAKPKEDNLWKIAGARLDEKSQEYLDIGGNSDLNATIQALVDETRAACEEYEKGGFRIQIHGKNINVRDSVQSILISALQVQDIIKAGAAFDPTGHGRFIPNNF
ncbi:hypothetical protein AWENTII_006895 [Aspergillus wentii]